MCDVELNSGNPAPEMLRFHSANAIVAVGRLDIPFFFDRSLPRTLIPVPWSYAVPLVLL